MRTPDGYVPVHAPDARAFARNGEEGWIGDLLRSHGTLYEAAAHLDDVVLLEGRAPVYVVPSPKGRRVVRRYHRGGAVAPLLGDRHLRLGPPRPLREAEASRAARDRGIATPAVTAGAVYASGLFYRADLVTEYLPGSVELADLLFDEGGASMGPDEALERAGDLLSRMAAAGLRHPDLNARNIVFAPPGEDPQGRTPGESPAPRRAVVLDLDRCRPTPDGTPVSPSPMLRRLERSLEKLGTSAGRPLEAGRLEILRNAARSSVPPPAPGTG